MRLRHILKSGMQSLCPQCHIEVRPTDYYCFNCGNNLHSAPPSEALVDIIILFAKSLLLPPFGVYWAYKYLRADDSKRKFIGIIAILITLISFAISIVLFKNVITTFNEQLNTQLNSFSY